LNAAYAWGPVSHTCFCAQKVYYMGVLYDPRVSMDHCCHALRRQLSQTNTSEETCRENYRRMLKTEQEIFEKVVRIMVTYVIV
jgi:hypothetical protein